MFRALPRFSALLGATALSGIAFSKFALAHDAPSAKKSQQEGKASTRGGGVLKPRLVQVIHRHGARTPVVLDEGQSIEEFTALWSGHCESCEGEKYDCNLGNMCTALGVPPSFSCVFLQVI